MQWKYLDNRGRRIEGFSTTMEVHDFGGGVVSVDDVV